MKSWLDSVLSVLASVFRYQIVTINLPELRLELSQVIEGATDQVRAIQVKEGDVKTASKHASVC